MEEAEICGSIAIIDNGKLAAHGTADELKKSVASDNLPKPSLNDVFLELTGKQIRDEPYDKQNSLRNDINAYRRKVDHRR
ncbi:ABC transporter ATP-binding protein [Candidatus Magnetoovum chiemensis]|nr:ABC transporter ATP-binding protein [Candidatus Magnetoovum chiemensis]